MVAGYRAPPPPPGYVFHTLDATTFDSVSRAFADMGETVQGIARNLTPLEVRYRGVSVRLASAHMADFEAEYARMKSRRAEKRAELGLGIIE